MRRDESETLRAILVGPDAGGIERDCGASVGTAPLSTWVLSYRGPIPAGQGGFENSPPPDRLTNDQPLNWLTTGSWPRALRRELGDRLPCAGQTGEDAASEVQRRASEDGGRRHARGRRTKR